MGEKKREDMANGEEGGISIKDIFRIIGKKIWYVLGGSLLITLVAGLIFILALNPILKSDSMSFRIDYPLYSQGKYPDGSVFDYRSIISREVIEETKKGNSEFASINVSKLIKNEGITISAQKAGADEPYVYTISLKNFYFKGIDTYDFVEALTKAFVSRIIVNEKVDNSFDFRLDPATFSGASFKDQIDLLSDLKGTLLNQYNNWISAYSAGRIVNGKPLSSYRADVITVFADNVKTPIENILTFKGYEYFNKNVTADDVKARVGQLQDELKLDLAILKELKNYYTESSPSTQADETRSYTNMQLFASATDEGNGSGGGDIVIMPGDSDLSQKMAYYSERTAIVQQQIMRLTNIDSADETTDLDKIDFSEIAKEIKLFGETYLDGEIELLNEKAETLKSVISAIYTKDTTVIFNSQKMESDGGVSLAIVVIAVFVVSFLVFAMIAYFKGKKQQNKQPDTPPSTDEKEESKSE